MRKMILAIAALVLLAGCSSTMCWLANDEGRTNDVDCRS